MGSARKKIQRAISEIKKSGFQIGGTRRTATESSLRSYVHLGLLPPNLTKMEQQTLTVGYFRERVSSEVARLRGLCTQWDSRQNDMVEEHEDTKDGPQQPAADDVRCAIGKANILIAGRIRQFSTLIDDCEVAEKSQAKTSERPITRVTDLQGFWEMVGLQIEDVDKLFLALDPANKSKGDSVTGRPKVNPRRCGSAPPKPKQGQAAGDFSGTKKKRPASSALKAHISAKRKELGKSEISGGSPAGATAVPDIERTTPDGAMENQPDNRVFDGGFFKVQSPCAVSPRKRLVTDLLSPSGFNSRCGTAANTAAVKKTPSSGSRSTPLAIMRVTNNARLSLSPSAVGLIQSKLSYDD